MTTRLSWKLCAAAVSLVIITVYCGLALLSEKCSYGCDGDAFLSALSALNLKAHGEYAPSRLPGFPLFERLLSLTALPEDARKSKLLLATVSFIDILLLFFLFRRMRVPCDIASLACLAAAVFPFFAKSAMVVMDYQLMLLFALAAAYLFPQGDGGTLTSGLRVFGAGLLVSLAIASRLTAVLFVAALCLVLLVDKQQGIGRWPRFVLFCLGAVILAPIFHFETFRIYGMHLLSGYPRDYTLIQLVAENTRVWVRFFGGFVGIASLAVVLWPLVRPSKGFLLVKTWNTFPTGIRAFVAFGLLNSLFYCLYPYEVAYHMPLWFALILLFGSSRPGFRRLSALVFTMALSCVVTVVPSAAKVVKVLPGPVVEELSMQRRQAIMCDRLSVLAGAGAPHTLFLSYSAVEIAPVWFFDSCIAITEFIHPRCYTLWKSPTQYRLPMYTLNNLVLASPLHLLSESGARTLRGQVAAKGISRVFIDGEETEGSDSAAIAAFFGPGVPVEPFAKEMNR